MAKYLYRLGRWSVIHRRTVLLAWLGVMIAIAGLSATLDTETSDAFVIPGTESQEAFDLLAERFPSASGTSGQIVFAAEEGTTLQDATAQAAIADTLAEAAQLENVIAVTNPFETGSISPDGTIGYATVNYSVETSLVGLEGAEHLIETGEIAEAAGVRTAFGGDVITGNPEQHPPTSELIGMGVAVIVLLFAFGSVLAMGIPLVTAIIGLGVGLMGITLSSAFFDLSSTAPTLATMIGLAVGIDYALFIVTRHRQGMSEGLSVEEAAARANATAGSAVVFAGLTVVIAIAGLAVVGIPFLTAMGLATAGVVLVAVMIAITLLPAMLGFAGTNIDRWKAPGMKAKTSAIEKETFGTKWAKQVTKRPVAALIGGLLFMGILAIPLLDMRLGMTDAGTAAPETTQRQAYDYLAEGFGPGFNGPLLVVVDLSDADDPAVATVSIQEALAADENIEFVSPAVLNETGDTATLQAIPRSGPADAETDELVNRLRDGAIPLVEAETGAEVSLTGSTAANIDISQKLSSALPVFMLLVIGLTVILLAVVFRSILVPIKAALAILLSIASSFGVVVAVFQWGWAKELIGLEDTVPIISFMPIMLFAILFGLSMDYEVFIMSRIREDYSKTKDAHASVLSGLASSTRVITAAALIMISVFAAFILGDDPIIKMFGLGLAVAVLLDATVVRMIIVPAVMTIFGDKAWWFPKALDNIIPNVDIEGEELLHELEVAAGTDTDVDEFDSIIEHEDFEVPVTT